MWFMNEKALALLKELAEAHGVPGHESAVRKAELAQGYDKERGQMWTQL